MSLQIAERAKRIKPSPTLAVTAKAAELRASGKDIIGLGAGEPDFDTPDHIKQAAIAAINAGFTKYTVVDGIPELKAAIIAKFNRDNGLSYQSEQVLVSCGGKQSFFNLTEALLNPGDEVIIPAPYWVSYPDIVALTGAKPVVIPTHINDRFKINAQQLEQAITPQTRLFVINSPSNPSGTAYTRDELKSIAAVLLEHPQVLIATDDMYEHILWARSGFHNLVTVEPKLYARTFVLNGVSKAYAMTGWRIGYCAGPTELIQQMKKIQSQSTSNPCSIAQKAAVAALAGDQSCITQMVDAFKTRHDYVVEQFNSIANVQCIPSDGTFYSFPDVSALLSKHPSCNTDIELAEYLLNHAEVALVPGSAFGSPGHLRLSYAASMDNLVEALTRIKAAVA